MCDNKIIEHLPSSNKSNSRSAQERYLKLSFQKNRHHVSADGTGKTANVGTVANSSQHARLHVARLFDASSSRGYNSLRNRLISGSGNRAKAYLLIRDFL